MPIRYSSLGARQQESDIARLMTMALERPELLSLAAGFTDTRSLPLDEVTELASKLGQAGDKSILQYGSNQGRPQLRELLTARLAYQDGIPETEAFPAKGSMITNGSQQALYLAIQTLCDPGDAILVEQPTYFVFLELLRGLGVEAIPMPMLHTGDVDVEELEKLLARMRSAGELQRVKGLYLVSYYANPSAHSVSIEAKKALVDLLARLDSGIVLLEDAAYRELYYESPYEAASVVALAAEAKLPAYYTTTMTKPFASGLKIGYAYCTEPDWLRRMLAVKGQQDFGSAHYPQALAALALVQGVFDKRLEQLRCSYLSKMRCLDAALQPLSELGWRWERPKGGLYLWLSAPEGVATDFDSQLHDACIEEGVMYVPGTLCFAERKPNNCIRLSFGVLELDQLTEAGGRFVAAARGAARASV